MSLPLPPPDQNPQQQPPSPFQQPYPQQPPYPPQPPPPPFQQPQPVQQQYQQQYPQQPYQQQPYQQQPYQQGPVGYQPYGMPQVAQLRTNGFAVASMVLGIVGIVLFCLYAIPPLLATIFGGVALKQFKEHPNTFSGRGMAVAGLVLGIIGMALFVLLLVAGNTRFNINR